MTPLLWSSIIGDYMSGFELPRHGDDEDRLELRFRLESEIQELRVLRSKLKSRQYNIWRHFLGDRLDAMLESRTATLDGLNDASASIRQGALRLLAYYWDPDPAMEQRYMQMLATDPNSDVRASAILCLVHLSTENSKDDICRMCAHIARDSANTRNLRAVAYKGLLTLKGYSMTISMGRAFLNRNVDLDTLID